MQVINERIVTERANETIGFLFGPRLRYGLDVLWYFIIRTLLSRMLLSRTLLS